MGIEMTKVTLKWDAETIQCSDELQSDFSPFAENRSQLSRVVYKLFHKIVRTHGTLQVIADHWQGCLRPMVSDAQLKFDFPSLAAPEKGAHREQEYPRPRIVSISRRSVVRRRAAVGMEAWGSTFLAGLRRAQFSTRRRA
jgi:hypothetical protein